jgi:hypothetical protein
MTIHSSLERPFIDAIKAVLAVFEQILNETLRFYGFIEWLLNSFEWILMPLGNINVKKAVLPIGKSALLDFLSYCS